MKIQLPAGGWQPRPAQMRLWSYLEQGGKNAVAVWHRRYGKDELALRWASVAMVDRPGTYWHMLPEATQARKAIWEAINPHTGKRRIDEAFPKELRKATRENEMFIKFGESTWQVVGSDNFNSLVGSPPIGIVYSEWPLANPSAAAYLRPILAENNGWELFIYTPRGRNHGLTTYERAKKDPASFAERLTVDDTKAITPERLAQELAWYKDEYGQEDGDAFYRQEYYCDFNAPLIGAILGRYIDRAERENRVSDEVHFDPEGAPIEISSDIGFRDTSAWWFWQPKLGGYALIDHDADRGLDADGWIERLQTKGYPIGHIWLPKDAKAKTFQSRRSAMERFLSVFGSSIVRVVPADSIVNRINAARRIIARCEFAHSACAEGLDGLRAWCYEWDDELRVYGKEPKHDWACFTQDTEVLTRYGTCQIMNLPENGEVLTPCGWKEYQGPRLTRLNARLVEVVFSDGHTVKCTPDHLFLTDSGWKSAESLTPGLLVRSSLTRSRSISMAVYTACGRVKDTFLGAARSCIEKFGDQHSVRFHQVVTSIIGMGTLKTTTCTISNASTRNTIWVSPSGTHRQKKDSPNLQEKKPPHGIALKQGCFGIRDTGKESNNGKNGLGWINHASSAASFLRRLLALAQPRKNSAPTFAASLTIASVKPLSERADTCCIHVPDGEWFTLAGGAVVHNSHHGDAFSYGAQVMELAEAKEPKKEDFPSGYTLNDLWHEHDRHLSRVQRI